MREGWQRVALGDTYTLMQDRVDDPRTASGLRYVGMEHIEPGVALRQWGDPTSVTSAKTRFSKGDVLFGRLRPYLRKVARAPWDGLASTEILVLRAQTDRCLPEMLHLLIGSEHVLQQAIQQSAGSRMPRTSARDLAQVAVSLPPLDEQRRIVDLIGSLDATIAATDQAVAKAEQARRASIVASIGGQDPRRSLTRVTLAEITSFAGGYAFPEKHQGQDSGDVPFLKVSDMNSVGNETTITRANHWVSESTLTAMRARAWPPGTVIFPKVGAALLTEKRRVLGERAAFDNNIMGLIPGPLVEPGFLLAFMETVRLGRLAQPGAVPSVNQKHIDSIPLALPSLGDQRCIMGIIAAFDDATAALRATTGAARVTRRGMLSGLLSGAHEIPSTYDRLLEAA